MSDQPKSQSEPISIGVLTSGGDAPGMNAAVRAVVRTARHLGAEVYAIHDGYHGMVTGAHYIHPMKWEDVGGILHQGGTVIGTARCPEFRTRDGRRDAARNLVDQGIDRLVIIGGDGSLTGANTFRQEWPELLAELVEAGSIDQETADAHPELHIVGLVGSIDNDMFGTDMTIGADTALHRITEAVDAITSTAASHQRTFVVEVMGRHCGYLALMGGLATGANWVLIPEKPADIDDWEDEMCRNLHAGRETGRRHSIVVVAEGACDREGNPISSDYVKRALEERLGEDVRITILGHVQRGGAPSAFDRYMSTVLGHAAATHILQAGREYSPEGREYSPEGREYSPEGREYSPEGREYSPEGRGDSDEAELVGIRQQSVIHSPLMESVAKTREVAEHIANHEYEQAMAMRGGSFSDSWRILRTLLRAHPHEPEPGQPRLRLAVMHCGAPAPGMNTAVRAAVRLGLDWGHTMLGVQNGFVGLAAGDVQEMSWMSVTGWVSRGGAELGTNRHVPSGSDFYAIARQLESQRVDGLLLIGGWEAYESAYALYQRRQEFPSFNIPIVCLPASIDNNLPGSQLSIGADTALNVILSNVDKIKQSAVASRRCFVVEVMGGDCGYLALITGLASGAERVYLPEEGVTLADLQADVGDLIEGFEQGKRLGLMIRSERADDFYTADFVTALFEKEGGDLFDVRQAILGHVQQGGDPSPFDRIQAIRLAARCIDYLIEQGAGQAQAGRSFALGARPEAPGGVMAGLQRGQVQFTSLEDFPRLIEPGVRRTKSPWWLELRPIARIMAKPGPG